MDTMREDTLPLLNRHMLERQEAGKLMPGADASSYPVRALQIGEGNFLRGFIDWMLFECNRQGLFRGSVAVSQPRPGGKHKLDQLREQDGIYGLLTKGIQNGHEIEERQLISIFSRFIDPYSEWKTFLSMAENPELDLIVSNTTEAGICYEEIPWNPSEPPATYPGKLALLLNRRFEHFQGDPDAGLMIVPCELLERNGDALKAIVLRHADDWGLSDAFRKWVEECNRFLNSLVDRIVTGYPDNAPEYFREWGFEDRLLNTAEPYYFLAIEGDPSLDERLPLKAAGLQVEWVPDLTPYQIRKVRILNGTHTLMALIGLLHGLSEVREAAEHPVWGTRIQEAMLNEIVPLVPLPSESARRYADAVWERFLNPFIRHKLGDIAMNSVSKFKVRLLPGLKGYADQYGKLPDVITLTLSSLIRLYQPYRMEDQWLGTRLDGKPVPLRDDPDALAFLHDVWQKELRGEWSRLERVNAILGSELLWGEKLNDFPGLVESVHRNLQEMERKQS